MRCTSIRTASRGEIMERKLLHEKSQIRSGNFLMPIMPTSILLAMAATAAFGCYRSPRFCWITFTRWAFPHHARQAFYHAECMALVRAPRRSSRIVHDASQSNSRIRRMRATMRSYVGALYAWLQKQLVRVFEPMIRRHVRRTG